MLVAVVLVGGWWGVHADKKHKKMAATNEREVPH